jgi:hypothetical protein
VLIGPPPPALVSEVESANEAERFEEVLIFILFFSLLFQYELLLKNIIMDAGIAEKAIIDQKFQLISCYFN